MACTCASIGAPDVPRLCAECHCYWKGDKRLVSVTKVLRAVWPVKPDFSAALPGVLENARDRGVTVDNLFCAWLSGELTAIPRGTRLDAVDLFDRLRTWWDGRAFEAETQVVLADDRVAGTCDLIADSHIYDLKTTYNIEPMYEIQLGGYADLYFATRKEAVKGLGIIHLTKRYREPKLVKVDLTTALRDWMLVRDTYFMAMERTR